MVNLNEFLYVPQYVKNLFSISRLVSNGSTMEANQDKITINKNAVIMILEARKGKNASIMFYLEKKLYVPEGKVALTNIPEEKKYNNEKK